MCQYSDKFFSAVRALAGDGPIKQRLFKAYSENLDLLSEDNMPESIRPRFELLRETMHSIKPTSVESPILASVRKMSATEASRCAVNIVSMFSELVRVKSTGERLRLKKNGAAAKQAPAAEHRDVSKLN